MTTVTWTVNNTNSSSAPIVSNARGVDFSPNQIPGSGASSGSETVTGPASEQQLTITVVVDLGDDVISSPSATVTLQPCVAPTTSTTSKSTTTTTTTHRGDDDD